MYFKLETFVEESVVAYVKALLCTVSGFRREADENRAILGYYAASSGQFLTHVSEQPIGPIFREEGIP